MYTHTHTHTHTHTYIYIYLYTHTYSQNVPKHVNTKAGVIFTTCPKDYLWQVVNIANTGLKWFMPLRTITFTVRLV